MVNRACLSLGFVIVVTSLTVTPVQGQYENVRCKCVCSPVQVPNRTDTTLTDRVFVEIIEDSDKCSCENVVDESLQKDIKNFCDRCECRWQKRSTVTIKVVVFIIIGIISLLFLYMLFLLCLDPLLARTQSSYQHQFNEEVNLDTGSVHRTISTEPSTSAGATAGTRQRLPSRDLVSRVGSEVSRVQTKWKGQVQEQRKNIFDSHIMLN